MNKEYSNRQQKIYADYSGYSSENLSEMITSNKYIAEVKKVLNDIIVERRPDDSPIKGNETTAIGDQPSNVSYGNFWETTWKAWKTKN